ncbi:hypothetical protein JYU34_021769 [Plutella xylostella]|uniref:Uncharacterized protein n=1 Tax=Plutella xylostella TaxID=51655 RepID=A0ABQ7PRD9_PLUXY|nr:hypothetical protein JYU34_021769 [Plutella xylostella]
MRASHAAFACSWSPLENSSTPTVIGSSADMTSPLPLQLAYFDSYVGNLSPLTDNLISDTIHQRNPKHSSLHSTLSDFKSVDQSYRQCPRLCTIRHHWQDALVEDFCLQALRNGRGECDEVSRMQPNPVGCALQPPCRSCFCLAE